MDSQESLKWAHLDDVMLLAKRVRQLVNGAPGVEVRILFSFVTDDEAQ
jgi:hypothetical protein